MTIRALAEGGAVRVVAVELTDAAIEAVGRHALAGDAVQLMSEAMCATALLAAHIKGEERIMLELQASKPRCSALVEVGADGQVRARMRPTTLLGMRDGVLQGIAAVIKSDAERELYRGTTEVATETLESALSKHLSVSSQVDAFVRIGFEAEAGQPTFVGGFLVERLPASDELPTIERDEFALRVAPPLQLEPVHSVLDQLREGRLLADSVQTLERAPFRWACRCSLEKVESTLASLGAAELQDMAHTDGQAEVICHFCNEAYIVDAPRLLELMEALDNV